MGKLEWIPMESNPEVMNSFLRRIGVKPNINVVDILGFDDDLLSMVDGKVEGVLLCYPMSESKHGTMDTESGLYFMRQTIRNACATMAIIHLLANQCSDNDFEPNSSIKEFIRESQMLDPEVKANKFETCDTIATAHESSSVEGQTEAPAASESVEYHFISIIYHNNHIYEMDGRKKGPIKHRETTEGTFLKDSMEVVKKFINLDPAKANFSMQAITRTQ